MPKRVHIKEGDRYWRLTVIKELEPRKTGKEFKRWFLFKCDCGNITETYLSDVRRGHTQSCGCIWREVIPTLLYKHGLKQDRLYDKWCCIKSRCFNPNVNEYMYYGGRGITLFDEWIENPVAFISYCKTLDGWDDRTLSIDRIDTNGNYEPGNIRFSTAHIQACNQRRRKSQTQYVGVVKRRNNFISEIHVNGIHTYFGSFKTIEEAVMARNNFIKENGLTEYAKQQLLPVKV